jgi:hypothetical protein
LFSEPTLSIIPTQNRHMITRNDAMTPPATDARMLSNQLLSELYEEARQDKRQQKIDTYFKKNRYLKDNKDS